MKLQVIDSSRRLRASSLERSFACMASSILPSVDRITAQGEKGTRKHADLDGKFDLALSAMRKAGIPESASCQSEIPLQYNVTQKDPCYDFDLITGHCDGYSITTDGKAIVVWDYKTGEEVEHPRSNKQLKFYALALARIHGLYEAYAAIIYLRDSKEPWVDWCHLEQLDLDAYSVELAELAGERANAIREEDADYKIGPHCKYCGSLPWCEPQGRMLRMAVQAKPWSPGENITQEEAREAYDALRRLDETSGKAWDAVRAYASVEPIGPLPNGKFYKRDQKGHLRETK